MTFEEMATMLTRDLMEKYSFPLTWDSEAAAQAVADVWATIYRRIADEHAGAPKQ